MTRELAAERLPLRVSAIRNNEKSGSCFLGPCRSLHCAKKGRRHNPPLTGHPLFRAQGANKSRRALYFLNQIVTDALFCFNSEFKQQTFPGTCGEEPEA